MRLERLLRPRWLVVTLGLLLGSAAGAEVGSLAGIAVAQQSSGGAVLDATHLPPLLTLPGERVELEYDVHCAPAEPADVDEGCIVQGTVYTRTIGGSTFTPIPLRERTTNGIRQLTAAAPPGLGSHSAGFEYYAVIEAPALERRVVLPAGGADAPHVSRSLANPVEVALGRHDFGATRAADARPALARWGSGDLDVGLEGGRGTSPVGASAFDVDAAGRILLLDQVRRRLLRWAPGRRAPVGIPLSVTGTIADLAAASDGSVYVLESVAHAHGRPLVRRFDDGGRELEAIETAERGASQLRSSPGGTLVLSQPSHHWMPMMLHGVPASRAEQLGNGRAGRTVLGGSQVVSYRVRDELRVAIVSRERVTRSWRVTSETPLAEVQLAEPRGQPLVVVVRVYEASDAEFDVLVLDRAGLVQRFAVSPSDWAESAPLGRFKLVGRSLFRLGSTPTAAFVDRFDLEVQ
jgi:hypothetical protein